MAAAAEPLFAGSFEAVLFEWRGPAPFLFAAVPDDLVGEIKFAARQVSYGWGVVPAYVRVEGTAFQTSLFPKDGGFLVPVKVAVQRTTGARAGQRLAFELVIEAR